MERFRKNDLLVHRYNPDLGPGRVEEVDGRRIVVRFPKAGERLVLAASDSALRPLLLPPGIRVRVEATGEVTRVVARVEPRPDGAPRSYRLASGREATDHEVWPLELPDDPLERLAALDVDRAAAFRNRLDGLVLERTRQARGLGSFLGGRIALFPHQLHVAERATESDPVRWLLADEVGLGKTVEACLVLSRLLRTGRADRSLVVAPATLVVQWLGELWRKFHQTFVLLDRKRREDVVKEHGPRFNPFEAHRHCVIALEDLVGEPALVPAAERAGIALLVVDEAHRLERGRGDPGNEAYRAVAPLCRSARHVLLLSATPLEADTHGFFRLLELLRPDAYESEEAFLTALEEGRPLPPCTSATRRVDIGGLPPRVPVPVELEEVPDPPGLAGDLKRDEADPRVAWLVSGSRAFARGGAEEGKTLVFCHEMETLSALKAVLESATRRRVAIFHEELTPERRDLDVAEFRRADGPVFLVSTECGGEGRNFEFCRRLVLFDLPLDPAQVEQRIGRLDRINRTAPVEVVYFRPPTGFGAELVRLYEGIGLFREPLGGLERSLSHVEAAIRKAERFARMGELRLPVAELVAEVREAARTRQKAVYHHLHSAGYSAALADGVLARVPAGLDEAMQRFVLGACHIFGFETAERPGRRTFYVEFGGDALVEHLPGVPGGSRFLGTFDRAEAVAKEELDFFGSGHPLVEGLFSELSDGPRGRVALLRLERCGTEGAGLLFLRSGEEGLAPEVLDLAGNPRPEWARLLVEGRPALRGLSADEWFGSLRGRAADLRLWPKLCRLLAARASGAGRLEAVAAVRLLR